MIRRQFLKSVFTTLALLGLPFARRAESTSIPLFNCMVAGFQYYEGPRCLQTLRPGDRLLLLREPANPYDFLAVAVHTCDGVKLGFIPRHINNVPAAYLDNGKNLSALVHRIDPGGPPWNMLEITVVFTESWKKISADETLCAFMVK